MLKKALIIGLLSTLTVAVGAPPAAAATNDPYWSKLWGVQKIQAEGAWATTQGAGALIAVVDTGVDLDHPDLRANIVGRGADFADKRGPAGAEDEHGHGTHVAGTVAAISDNGVGVAGVAPDARILPVRVLDADGSGSTDDVADGIKYAADKGADVINLSLGVTSGISQVASLVGWLDEIYEATEYAWSKGAVVVAAAGNDTFPLCSDPAAAPHTLCVGATGPNDVRTFYSNSDATMTRDYLVAPGGDLLCADRIVSTWPTEMRTNCSLSAGYRAASGTSMATPHVSGVAALLASKGLTNDEIVACLIATTDDLGTPGRDPIYGYGRVNAYKAVTSC